MWDDSDELEGSSSSESPDTSTDEERSDVADLQDTAKPTDVADLQDTAEHKETTPGSVAKLLNTEKGCVVTGTSDVIIDLSGQPTQNINL